MKTWTFGIRLGLLYVPSRDRHTAVSSTIYLGGMSIIWLVSASNIARFYSFKGVEYGGIRISVCRVVSRDIYFWCTDTQLSPISSSIAIVMDTIEFDSFFHVHSAK